MSEMTLCDNLRDALSIVVAIVVIVSWICFKWGEHSHKKKIRKEEQDNSKKACIELRRQDNVFIIKNSGKCDARGVQLLINGKDLQVYNHENDFVPDGQGGGRYIFSEVKLQDNSLLFPCDIGSGEEIKVDVVFGICNSRYLNVQLVWDDDFESERRKEFRFKLY